MNQDLSIINLLLHASFVVQMVVLLLVIALLFAWGAFAGIRRACEGRHSVFWSAGVQPRGAANRR